MASTPSFATWSSLERDAGEVADAVAVGVAEGARVDLVDDGRAPPGCVHAHNVISSPPAHPLLGVRDLRHSEHSEHRLSHSSGPWPLSTTAVAVKQKATQSPARRNAAVARMHPRTGYGQGGGDGRGLSRESPAANPRCFVALLGCAGLGRGRAEQTGSRRGVLPDDARRLVLARGRVRAARSRAVGDLDLEHRLDGGAQGGLRLGNLERRADRDSVHDGARHAAAGSRVLRLRRRERPRPVPVPADAPIEGGSSSTGDRHVLSSTATPAACGSFTPPIRRTAARRGRPGRAPHGISARTRCARSAGRRATLQGSRSFRVSSATTRSPRERSTT